MSKRQAPRKPTAARRERMAEALKLRQAGANYRTIGERLGISHTQAANDVADALREVTREAAEDVRDLELARLDDLFLIAYTKAKTSDMRAVDTALKVMERRAKYLGLDTVDRGDDITAVHTLLEKLIHDDERPQRQ